MPRDGSPPEREVVRVTPLKFPIDHGGVLTAVAKAAGFVEIASTPAISHDEIKRFSDD